MIIDEQSTILDDIHLNYQSERRRTRHHDKPVPRAATLSVIEELDRCDSVDELMLTRGYMSAGQRRRFDRCESGQKL